MRKFIKGMELCEGFFNTCAKKIIEESFPRLKYSAGLIGYGSDVLDCSRIADFNRGLFNT